MNDCFLPIMSDTESDGSFAGANEDRLLAALEKSSKKILAPAKNKGRGRPPKKRKLVLDGGSPAASVGASSQAAVGSPSSSGILSSDKNITALLLELIGEVKNQGAVFGQRFNELCQEIQSLKDCNDNLTKKLKVRDEEVKDLRFRLENMEMREKQNEVVVSCPSIESMNKDDFSAPMAKLLRDNLDLPNGDLNLFSFKKIGKRALIRVPTAESRRKVFAAARSRRPANFYVNESLTPERSKFFYDVRSFLRASGARMISFTMFGVVHVKKNKNSDPVVIKSLDDLKLFLQAGTN